MYTYVRAPVSMWTRERCVYNIDGWVGVCVLFVPGTGVGGEGVQGGRIVDDENGYRASWNLNRLIVATKVVVTSLLLSLSRGPLHTQPGDI